MACSIQKVQLKTNLFIHKNYKLLALAPTQKELFSFCWSAFCYFLHFYYSFTTKKLTSRFLTHFTSFSCCCWYCWRQNFLLTLLSLKKQTNKNSSALSSTLPWNWISSISWSYETNFNSLLPLLSLGNILIYFLPTFLTLSLAKFSFLPFFPFI